MFVIFVKTNLYTDMWLSILGFILRMCIYIIFTLFILIPIGFLIGFFKHQKKIERIERHHREIFGDDD